MHLSSGADEAVAGNSATPTAVRARRQRVALDALAGALAGAISRVIVGPLDVIKIRFQVISYSTSLPIDALVAVRG